MNARKAIILLAHAFIGWFLCAATIVIGMAVTSLIITLIIHAIVAPIFFAGVIAMDFFIVALLMNRSLEMFTSPLGTWIPFCAELRLHLPDRHLHCESLLTSTKPRLGDFGLSAPVLTGRARISPSSCLHGCA